VFLLAAAEPAQPQRCAEQMAAIQHFPQSLAQAAALAAALKTLQTLI
jgi:hypothetical protein